MNFIKRLFAKQKNINPQDYGWNKLDDNYYIKKGGFILYCGNSGWILDKTPKNAAGVVERFGMILTETDMSIANNLATLSNPIRKTCK